MPVEKIGSLNIINGCNAYVLNMDTGKRELVEHDIPDTPKHINDIMIKHGLSCCWTYFMGWEYWQRGNEIAKRG